MDAITMRSTTLLKTLQSTYPQFSFVKDEVFHWSADTKTLHVDTASPDFAVFALHELGHALLDHTSYSHDIDLLKIERDAWHYATTNLAPLYDVAIDDETVQDNLDTYREWLHSRSLCPSCHMTGLQSVKGAYTCLACGCHWKSNDARTCALRRRTVQSI